MPISVIYNEPTLIAGPLKSNLYIEVESGTLWVAHEKQYVLETANALRIEPSHGIVHLEWEGELWARGIDAGTTVRYLRFNK
jgi:hypothetical protein